MAFISVFLLIGAPDVLAHSGGLDANGCHTNRKTGEYHCHGSKRAKKTDCSVAGGFCQGCGCKGGPGYRSNSTGRCVGYTALVKECGPYPHVRCTFENAPGTGDNKTCVLGE
jgi:hypothetical protein